MIFGDPYKFALYVDKFLYLDAMNDWDCMCGYFINGKACISDYSQLLYVQKQSIQGGSLQLPKESDFLFNLPLADAFNELIKHRYPNFIETVESSNETEEEWIEPAEDYLAYEADLESGMFGSSRYKLFVIQFEGNLRIISYNSFQTFNLDSLDAYGIEESYITVKEMERIIAKVSEFI